MKVSVIIPNYNHAQFLKQRIDSVLNQTLDDFEVIILDDHSEDNSKSVIECYRHNPKVSKIIYNEYNSGSTFLQWEKGLGMAKGDWVWFAESDDYADKTFLEKTIKASERSPNVGLVYCDSFVVDDENIVSGRFAELKKRSLDTDRWYQDYLNSGLNEIQDFLLPYGTINNSSAVLFRKDLLVAINPFDAAFRFIGDKYAFVKVLSFSEVAYVSQPLNYFRNPFNVRNKDKYIFYFYEQFLVFDWVQKHLNIDSEKFDRAFFQNIRNSLFRSWDRTKRSIYLKILQKNTRLALKAIRYNLTAPFGSPRKPEKVLI